MLIQMDETTYKELSLTLRDAERALSDIKIYKATLGIIAEALHKNMPLSLDVDGGLQVNSVPIYEILQQHIKESYV